MNGLAVSRCSSLSAVSDIPAFAAPANSVVPESSTDTAASAAAAVASLSGSLENFVSLARRGVADADDAAVGLDGGERVVRGQRPRLGQRVEQGGLADVGQTDDSDRQAHETRIYCAQRGQRFVSD